MPDQPPTSGEELDRALAAQIHDGERYRRFGELSAAEVAVQAERMAGLKGWGPLDRVRPIADAWRELGSELESAGADRVGELEPALVVAYASKLWLTTPPGGLIK